MIYHQSFKIKLTSSIYIAKTSLPEYVTSTSTDVPTVLLLYTQNRMITDRAKFYTVQFNNYLKATKNTLRIYQVITQPLISRDFIGYFTSPDVNRRTVI